MNFIKILISVSLFIIGNTFSVQGQRGMDIVFSVQFNNNQLKGSQGQIILKNNLVDGQILDVHHQIIENALGGKYTIFKDGAKITNTQLSSMIASIDTIIEFDPVTYEEKMTIVNTIIDYDYLNLYVNLQQSNGSLIAAVESIGIELDDKEIFILKPKSLYSNIDECSYKVVVCEDEFTQLENAKDQQKIISFLESKDWWTSKYYDTKWGPKEKLNLRSSIDTIVTFDPTTMLETVSIEKLNPKMLNEKDSWFFNVSSAYDGEWIYLDIHALGLISVNNIGRDDKDIEINKEFYVKNQ